jgi:hypothetical protein
MELLENERWYSQPVYQKEGTLIELRALLPTFKFSNFGEGENRNDSLRVVERQPIGDDSRRIPVATVSNRYALVQHCEIFDSLQQGIAEAGLDKDLKSTLRLSQYGERMFLTVEVPESDFDPGDSYKIRLNINCINSVDKSCALEINMSWLRLLCTNGMVANQNKRLRKIHNIDWMNKKKIADYLKGSFESALTDVSLYKEWINNKILFSSIKNWLEKDLTKKWGDTNAIRVYHILNAGYDVKLADRDKDGKILDRRVSYDVKVPGSTLPFNNIYQVNQALSWIASRQKSIEERQQKIYEIPDLIKTLLYYSS